MKRVLSRLAFVLCFGLLAQPQTPVEVASKVPVSDPTALAVDPYGNLLVIERGENRVRRINLADGTIETVAGNGKECCHEDFIDARSAALKFPLSLAVASNGDVYVSEISGYVRRIDNATGIISTVAGERKGGPLELGIATQVELSPDSIAVDNHDHLYIADHSRHQILRVTLSSGLVDVFAGAKRGFSGDGGPAAAASMQFPSGLAIDPTNGNLVFADYENCRIRMIDSATGVITTIAGNGEPASAGDGGPALAAALNYPDDVTLDGDGNIYFAEGATDRIRKIDKKSGIIQTVAGIGRDSKKHPWTGEGRDATKTAISNPSGIAIDSDGNLYISEYETHPIRRVDAKTGKTTIIGGNGLPDHAHILL